MRRFARWFARGFEIPENEIARVDLTFNFLLPSLRAFDRPPTGSRSDFGSISRLSNRRGCNFNRTSYVISFPDSPRIFYAGGKCARVAVNIGSSAEKSIRARSAIADRRQSN